MAKKILSIVLAVMMIATLCTVAFVSTSAETEYLNVTVSGNTYKVKVGDTFTIKKSVVLPEGYSVQGGKLIYAFDTDYVEMASKTVSKDMGDVLQVKGDYNKDPITGKAEGYSTAYSASEYTEDNALTADKDNFGTFKLKAIKAGTITIEEIFEIGVFSDKDVYTTISNFTGGTYSTATTVPTYEEATTEATEPSTEATEPSTEATEPSTEATEPSTEATEPSTEATEPSTEADNFLTIIRGNNTYKVKVGDTFTVKKALALPEGYAIQGGKFTVYFDTALATPIKTGSRYATKDLKSVFAVDGMTKDGNGVSVAYASDSYSEDNVLTETKDNFATFTFVAKAAGTLTIDEAFEYGVFALEAPSTVIEVFVNGEVKNDAIYNAASRDTIIGVPEYPTEPVTEPSTGATEPSTDATQAPTGATQPATPKTGETTTVVFALVALMAMAGVAVVIARKKATK